MAALSHIYPLFWLLHTEPSSPTPLGLVATSPPTHSDTCQQEDMTVMFLKGALCMNYCSFLVCCTGRQGSRSGLENWKMKGGQFIACQGQRTVVQASMLVNYIMFLVLRP